MKHYYLSYAHLLFKEFGLPEDLISPIIRLMEACSASMMSEYQFRALMANNDLTDPAAVLRLVEVLRAKQLERTSWLDDLFRDYPLLSPQNFPKEVAVEICGYIYAAEEGSKPHEDKVRAWARSNYYRNQIKQIIILYERNDDRFWRWCGCPDLLPKSRFQSKGESKNA